jgi:RNA polymerase sigma factor (TIGR02999 family)
MSTSEKIIRLLAEHRKGNRDALDSLLPLVYDELRALAARYVGAEGDGCTLQPTALVHEACERLLGQSAVEIRDRAQFVALAAQVMRILVVEHARGVPSDPTLGEAGEIGVPVDLVALDRALDRLGQLDETQSRIVEMRYFGGLSVDEIAEALGITPDAVERGWAMARAWLKRELSA